MHVPQPEVIADSSNPKGFGEPQWAVELHDRLLSEAGVQVSDSRPERVVRDRSHRHPRAARASGSPSGSRATSRSTPSWS